MRILLFTQYFWPENFHINEIALALKAHGHDVEVLTGKPNYPEGRMLSGYKAWDIYKELWRGIPIYRIPIFPRGMRSPVKLAINFFSFIFFGLFIAPWVLKKRKYDIIFVYGVSPIFQVIPASFLGWIKKVPVVLWVQDLWPQSAEATGYIKSPFLLKILEKAVKFSYSHTDLLLVQSQAFVKPVSMLAPNIPIFYFPSSVDSSFYSPNINSVPKISSLESGFTVLFAGNLGSAQAIETIVSAAERLKSNHEIKIVILGSGSKENWLAQQVVEKKLTNLYLEGRFPIELMPLLMRKASALLVTLANQPIFELTVPNKIQAYLAVGRPIIACLNGEGARIIKEAKAGVTINAEDAVGLADKIIQLYQTPASELEQMGINGRAYFKQNFEEKKLIRELIQHFQITTNKKELH